MVGMYRLKGTQFVKNLVPHPPTASTGSFVNKVSEEGVEIRWEAPKIDFSIYAQNDINLSRWPGHYQ